MKYSVKDINLINNNKFKTITILISFVHKKDFTKNSYLSFLSSILNASCDAYPSKKALYGKMYDLYNASLQFYASDYYMNNALNLSIEFVNPKYLRDDNLLDDIFSLTKEMLFNPLLNDSKDGFDEKTFNEKKRVRINAIKNIFNDKTRYAIIKLLENMKKEDEYPFTMSLNTKDIENIDNKELYSFYLDYLKNSKVYVSAYGDIDTKLLSRYIDGLNLNTNDINIKAYEIKDENIKEIKTIEEVQNISQAKLNFGYRSTISYESPMYPSLVIFNQMFGGMFASTLIRNIREKQSLVYSISSSLIAERKLLIINSGNDANKSAHIVEEIKKDLDNYQKGNIANKEELLNMAKESIISNINDINDNASRVISQAMWEQIKGVNRNVDEFVRLIKEVTIDDVINASKTLTLDTIYLLKGNENE